MCVDETGIVIACDSGNGRILAFNPSCRYAIAWVVDGLQGPLPLALTRI